MESNNDAKTLFDSFENETKAKILTISSKEILKKFEKDILSKQRTEKDRANFMGIYKVMHAINVDISKFLEGNNTPMCSYSKTIVNKEMERFTNCHSVSQYLILLNERESLLGKYD
jgi:hypothetical protein